MDEIRFKITNKTLDDYEKYYFLKHPKARKRPISTPYHPSMNTWMIMKRPMMNGLKQKWKEFVVWLIENQGYSNLHIKRCEMYFTTYYKTNRRHDVDNSTPKFILDGFSECGFLDDDDFTHLEKLTLKCAVDVNNPRTEIVVKILGD